jgi:hypothetical protein
VKKHIIYQNFVKVTMLVRSVAIQSVQNYTRVRKTENIEILLNTETEEVVKTSSNCC